jgi:hypothetical protein
MSFVWELKVAAFKKNRFDVLQANPIRNDVQH